MEKIGVESEDFEWSTVADPQSINFCLNAGIGYMKWHREKLGRDVCL